MRRIIFASHLLLFASFACAADNWPQFRGENASGVSSAPGPGGAGSGEAKWKVRWKVPVVGLGHSSPVVWNDRVFITTAVPVAGGGDERLKTGLYGDIEPVDEAAEYRWLVLCFDKATGKPIWEREAHRGEPKIMRHPKSSHANPSVAADGKRVVAFFGSEGLYAYDMDGTPLWKKDFGVLDSAFFAVPSAHWGFATSPVLFEDSVVVLADVLKGSFLAVLDAKTGEQRWRTPRNDVPTWDTPTVVRVGNRTQIVINGFKEIAGYDFADGKQIWRMSGGGDIPVPTPVVAHGLAFITGAHGPQSPIFAIRLDKAQGDVTLPKGEDASDAVAWSVRHGGNYMQTPIVVGELLYACRDNGVVSCFDAKTGTRHYRQRLDGPGFTASPVAAGDRVYFTSEDGRVHVIKAGRVFGVMSEHELGEACLATPAVVDGVIYFRTRGHLIAIAGD